MLMPLALERKAFWLLAISTSAHNLLHEKTIAKKQSTKQPHSQWVVVWCIKSPRIYLSI